MSFYLFIISLFLSICIHPFVLVEAWFYINKMSLNFIGVFTFYLMYIVLSVKNFQDANCGNTLLISLDELVKDGLLTKDELPEPV